MADDHGPIVQSEILRAELVRLRKARGQRAHDIAHEVGWRPSQLIEMEGGSSPISTVELDKLMTTYGLMDQPERERLQALNRGARSVGWWNAYRNDAPEPYLNYVSYE